MHQEVKNWWEQAKSDLKAARNSAKSKDYNWACFQAQQAAEKGLKALYIQNYQEIRKIHDLVFFANKFDVPEEIFICCARLSRVYAETRYPDAGSKIPAKKFHKDDANDFIEMAEKVLQWLKKKL